MDWGTEDKSWMAQAIPSFIISFGAVDASIMLYFCHSQQFTSTKISIVNFKYETNLFFSFFQFRPILEGPKSSPLKGSSQVMLRPITPVRFEWGLLKRSVVVFLCCLFLLGSSESDDDNILLISLKGSDGTLLLF